MIRKAIVMSVHSGGEVEYQRGTVEQWIKEGKNEVNWTRLSCRWFDANQVRLQLHVLDYHLGNFLCTLPCLAASSTGH